MHELLSKQASDFADESKIHAFPGYNIFTDLE